MSIPEAAQLVIQAGAMSKGCDVFVLDMGEPLKILDLIKRIIKLSGLSILDKNNPEGDIKIKIIGLRPGEKLFEELLLGENTQNTLHDKNKAEDPFMPWKDLSIYINELEILVKENDLKGILNILKKLVIGFKPSTDIVDRVFSEKEKRFSKISPIKKIDNQKDKKIIRIK